MIRVRRPARFQIASLLVGLTVFTLAAISIAFTRLNDNVALLWMATAPVTAALCVWPPRRWGAFIAAGVLGSAAATLAVSPYISLIPVFAVANIGEAVIAAALLRRMRLAEELFVSTRSIAPFVVAAGIIGPAIGGIPVALAIEASTGAASLPTWSNWVLGHGLGSIIGAPLAMLILRRILGQGVQPQTQKGRLIATSTLTAAIAVVVFRQDAFPLLFLPMLPVLIATFSLRTMGAAVSIVIVALVGAGFTLAGHGPMTLMSGDEAARLQFFQFYLGTLFVMALPVATTLLQRDGLTRALATSEARFRLMTEHATDIMVTMAPTGLIEYISPSIRDLGQFDPAQLVGTQALLLVVEADRDRVRATHLQALAAPDRTFRVEYQGRKATGELSWFENNLRAVTDEDGQVTAIVAVIRDLTQRKAREEELERAAERDPMTGLLNREVFRRALGTTLHKVRRNPGHAATLALIDLDHFKRVNDTHGHGAGDTAILVLADLMRASVRASDHVGRIGGEEFAILFDGASLEAAEASCERIREALSRQPIPCDAGTFRITASMGLTPLSAGTTVDRSLARADAALYRAKGNGRDRVERAVV